MSSIIEYTPDNPYPSEIGAALFSATPNNQSLGVNVGTVQLNSVALEINDPSNNLYSLDAEKFNLVDSTVWRVSGGSGVAAFTYTNPSVYPHFAASIPDTISKSGWTYVVSSTNVDTIVVTFPYTAASTHSIGKNSGTLSFSAADLAALPANQEALLQVSVANFVYPTINGSGYISAKEERREKFV